MSDSVEKPPITPDLKVGALLKAYPDLEEVLIEIAPVFKKLRNPILRQTVAKITSLRQAAKVGGVSLGKMISELRTAAGQEEAFTDEDGDEISSKERPQWLIDCISIETFDAREQIESGGHPLGQVMAAINKLEAGHAFAIITPFVPSPMIDQVEKRGFQAWTEQKAAEHFITYFGHGAVPA